MRIIDNIYLNERKTIFSLILFGTILIFCSIMYKNIKMACYLEIALLQFIVLKTYEILYVKA